jgi:hypothetical protein
MHKHLSKKTEHVFRNICLKSLHTLKMIRIQTCSMYCSLLELDQIFSELWMFDYVVLRTTEIRSSIVYSSRTVANLTTKIRL